MRRWCMPFRAIAVLASLGLLVGSLPTAQVADGWELVVLGVAQDAGSPQLGCQQDLCVDRRAGKRPVERVSSLGLIHRPSGTAYLFDATPDLPSQLHSLNGGTAPDGIFLTHGHVGHYTGLMYLGRESISASKVPVYATDRMWSFLSTNGPWSQLVTLGNILHRQLQPDVPVKLPHNLTVRALVVPHRDEFTDTVVCDRRTAPQSVVHPRHRSMVEVESRHSHAGRRCGLCVCGWHVCVSGRNTRSGHC